MPENEIPPAKRVDIYLYLSIDIKIVNLYNIIVVYRGVAQLVARLLWEQDAGSSSLPTRTKKPESTFVGSGFFFLTGDSNSCRDLPVASHRTSTHVGALYDLCRMAQMQTSLPTCLAT